MGRERTASRNVFRGLNSGAPAPGDHALCQSDRRAPSLGHIQKRKSPPLHGYAYEANNPFPSRSRRALEFEILETKCSLYRPNQPDGTNFVKFNHWV